MGKGQRPTYFKLELGNIINDKNKNMVVVDRKLKEIKCKSDQCKSGFTLRHKVFYKIHCFNCGYKGWMSQNNLLSRGDGCPCCSNKVIVKGINDIATTCPRIVEFLKFKDDAYKYSKNSSKKVMCVCPNCKSEKKIYIQQLSRYGFSCSKCSDGISYPNKLSREILTQLNRKYGFNCLVCEYSQDWSKPFRYDNYFEYNNNKYIVEMDGVWHQTDNKLSGQTAEDSLKIDDIKNELAEAHGIIVIRINCSTSTLEYIKSNIYSSLMSNIFDLDTIDWKKADENSQKSLVRVVCDYFNMYCATTKELVELFQLNKTTIVKYLKIGNKFGWCVYKTPKEIGEEKVKHIAELINQNPNLSSKDISEVVDMDKYIVRQYIDRANKLGLCSYDLSKEADMNKSISLLNLVKPKKRVAIYDLQNNLLRVYNSIVELQNNSIKDFGIYLDYEGIRRNCKLQSKQYKGFLFRYVE